MKKCGEVFGRQSKTVVLARTVKMSTGSQFSAPAAKRGVRKSPTASEI